jgi:glycosyltransferase involved in cell wall biosynthesis
MMQQGDGISEPFFTVSRRVPHHAEHSGYDELARYVGRPVETPAFLRRFRGLGLIHRYFRQRSGMKWYDGLYAEVVTSLHMRKQDPAVYHFLFAERDYRYLPVLKPDRRHKVIGTFHAAPQEFSEVMKRTEHLKSLDAAIVVARNIEPAIQRIVGKEKLFFVPHGVDTHYFVPSRGGYASSKRCISVGHHHRDFETLARVASIVKQKDPDVTFVVIDRVFDLYFTAEEQEKIRESFNAATNVELKTDLTDQELLAMYQNSDLMVLPMFEATANVALLEAISCGLPLVVSDISGVADYVSSNEAALAPPRDAEQMAEHVLGLLGDHEQRERLSIASRNRALQFDWRIIAEQIRGVYRKVLEQNQ